MTAFQCSGCASIRFPIDSPEGFVPKKARCRCSAKTDRQWTQIEPSRLAVDQLIYRLAAEGFALRKRTRNQRIALKRLQRAYDAKRPPTYLVLKGEKLIEALTLAREKMTEMAR